MSADKCHLGWFALVFILLYIKIDTAYSQDCEDGKYGTGVVDCSINCPVHCATNTCNKRSGTCDECEDGYYGDRCNTLIKCDSVSGDPREEPGMMNNSPGNVMNIFVGLTIPRSGKVSTVQYYSQRDRRAFIGFWKIHSQSGNRYNVELMARIRIDARTGPQEEDVRNKNIFVEQGYAIGIHYHRQDGNGAFYYERNDRSDRTPEILDSDLYEVINSGGKYEDNLNLGTVVEESIQTGHKRAVALKVFIECEQGCTSGQYGPDASSCSNCSSNCEDNLTCDPVDGTCPAGCSEGWQNRLCNTACEQGAYGENCLNTCPGCINNDCDAFEGKCNDGCTSGYEGEKCDQPCSGGNYGDSCNFNCSTFCDDVCDHIDGTCSCNNGGTGPLCSTEAEKQDGKNGDGGDNIGVIVGAIVGVVVVAIILLVVVIILYRRKKKQSRKQAHVSEADVKFSDLNVEDQKDEDTLNWFVFPARTKTIESDQYEIKQQEYANDVSKPISVSELEAYIAKERKLNPEEPFAGEYSSIPSNQTEKWDFANQKELKPKNRFKNIMPYDHNRVELGLIGDDPLSTYINASFLPNFKREKAYIGSSGPSKTTIGDFWRMVWEYNSKVIVMVTRLVESMAIKCEQYWPASLEGLVSYGDITVAIHAEEKWMDFESRLFIVQKDGEERQILHLMYTGWPDHGVPQHASGILRVRKQMLHYQGNSTAPIIVHCSAGIGRTGTFIAIDYLLEQGKKEKVVDVYALVNRLRSYRINMVQTKDQYWFIYQVLCEALCYGESTISCAEFKRQYEADLKSSSHSHGSLMEQKFEFLGRLNPEFHEDEFEEANSSNNIEKNRDKHVVPAEKHRIYLADANGRSIYINAVHVNGFRTSREFLATQIPLKTTTDDFWTLMLINKCSTIVCLEDATDGTMWYPCPEGPMICGNAVIKHIDTKLEGGFIQHQLLAEEQEMQQTEYANVDTSATCHHIRLFHLPSWSQAPLQERNPATLIQFVNKVEQWKKANSGEESVTVVCLNGATESGLYIAASHLISMASTEEELDVFRTVKEIRTTRPPFIETLEQYDFLHRLVLAYLKSPYYLPKTAKLDTQSSL